MTLSGPGGVGKPGSRSRSRLRHPRSPGRCGLWSSPCPGQRCRHECGSGTPAGRVPGHEIDLICDYLSRRRGLLVLDTREHVVEAVAGLATRLLSRCPDLRSSRPPASRCGLPGSRSFNWSGLDEAAGAEAFTSRAWAANPALELDAGSDRPSSPSWRGFRWRSSWLRPGIASLSLQQLITGLGQPLDALAGDARG